jgi:hypothetical protein
MEAKWDVQNWMKAEINPTSTDVVYEGTYSKAITCDQIGVFKYVHKRGGLDTFGYTYLSFCLNPGTTQPIEIFVGKVSLVNTLGLDLSTEGWQEVSIPLDKLGWTDQRVASFQIIASLTGTFYMDNIRFVAPNPKITSVEEAADVIAPVAVALGQNYPNPFNAQTTIRYALPEASQVKLVVYDMLGQKVRTLADQHVPAGVHRFEWNGTDDQGHTVATGVYTYLLKTETYQETRRMVFLK